MTDEYMPPVDEVSAPWWEATRVARLLIQRCGSCAALQHYPRSVCATCGETSELGWVEAVGTGRIDTYTVVHRAPRPGVAVPYVIARIELTEGPVLLSSIVDTSHDAVCSGAAVALRWRPLPDGRQLPVFAVTDAEASPSTPS